MELTIGILIGLVIGAIVTFVIVKYQIDKPKDLKIQQLESDIANKSSELSKSEAECQRITTEYVDKSEDQKRDYVRTISNVLETSADNADNTSTELEEVKTTVATFNELIQSIKNLTESAYEISTEGMSKLNHVVDNLEALSNSRMELKAIQERFMEVQERTDSIRYISEEAEMLALNAAIEAARAGEVGRGFAVVADSMKSLSQNSQNATKEIMDIVTESDKEISKVVNTFIEKGDDFNVSIEGLIENFKTINEQISEVETLATEIRDDSGNTQAIVDGLTNKTKTAVEQLVKDLSMLISKITGVEIIDISPHEANNRLHEFGDIIDVRRPEEWNDKYGHIKEARQSTLQTDFQEEVKRLDPDKSYLFVCRSGGRSTKAAQMAIRNGVKQVYNLDGGMIAWRKANL